MIIASFLSLSHFVNEHTIFENSVLLVSELKQHSDVLIFEVHKYVNGVPYADPENSIIHMEEEFNILKNGGVSHNLTLNPLPTKFLNAHNIAQTKLIVYTNYVGEILKEENPKFGFNDLIFTNLDTAKFDTNGALDYLLSLMLEENKIYSKNLLILQIGLAILNVGVHVMVLLIILDLLRKQSEKERRLEKLASIGELASRVSHDIRNPLTTIKGVVDLLTSQKSTVTDEKDIQRLELIKKSVTQINHQVEDVLDYVRTNKISLEKTSLLEIINLAAKRVSIPDSVEVSYPEKDYTIRCDKLKMEIVFVNLLLNAVDAVRREGKIAIRMKSVDNFIEIQVEDSGPGIDSESISEIFEPLFTLKQKGTGLGLASCKNIIEQHEGTINVSNNPTTFTIMIPSNL
ncbi:two-component system sensor histidine kinase NtrB [Nitrosopumilus maritimus]|uniref:two-component system sensor histidine kinase NtrB n=1 Tax=Nitrosopumilus maritimus TaxID=338192 RepID=UPI000B0DE8B3|nr:ATP-binding protein [Nitrosopumilus maritimus]